MVDELPETVADADPERTFVISKGGQGRRIHLPTDESTPEEPDSRCARSHEETLREKKAAVLYDDLQLCERCRNAVTGDDSASTDHDGLGRQPADILREHGFEEAAQNAEQSREERLAENGRRRHAGETP